MRDKPQYDSHWTEAGMNFSMTLTFTNMHYKLLYSYFYHGDKQGSCFHFDHSLKTIPGLKLKFWFLDPSKYHFLDSSRNV